MNTNLFITRIDKLISAASSKNLLNALLRHRVLAAAEHRSVLQKDLKFIVDIGANRGQFALASRMWAANAQIISFEPLPVPAKVFRSIFAGDKMVTLYEVAIGPKLEMRTMHVSAKDDSSSLLPIASLQSKFFPGTEEISTITVSVAPLDTYVSRQTISSPAMLKLDVQGFEYEALCGCESVLSMFDMIYCECSFLKLYNDQKLASDVINWLYIRGWKIGGVFNTSYGKNGIAIQADLLFYK